MDEHSAFDPPPPIEPPPIEPPPPVIPWEDPSLPWGVAFIETVKQLTTRPRAALATVPLAGDVLRPVVFALIVGTIGVFFNSLWDLTLSGMFEGFLPAGATGPETMPRGFYVAMMALSPLIIALSLVLSTCVLHVSLLVTGGARSGFAATLRAICYGQLGNLALVIPFCGALVGGLWILVLEALALSALHRISIGRAIVALLLPLALCCACASVLLAVYGAALLSGLKGLVP